MTAESGTQTASYTYAGTDQRELTHETVPGGATFDYTYGRADAYGDPLIDTIVHSGTAGPITVDYNAQGTPQVLTTSGGSENYYVLDSLNDPLALVKTDGAEAGAYSYDPYGTYTDNNISGGSATGENPFRYAVSGTYDRATGYIKYGNRYYNPSTGRFTEPDTITTLADPGNANQYAYAGDDPINNIDPTGRGWLTDLGIGLIGLGIGIAVLSGIGLAGAGGILGTLEAFGIGEDALSGVLIDIGIYSTVSTIAGTVALIAGSY